MYKRQGQSQRGQLHRNLDGRRQAGLGEASQQIEVGRRRRVRLVAGRRVLAQAVSYTHLDVYKRQAKHVANASAIADAVAGHPALVAVHYPGLASHPDHALAAVQQSGPGGIVTLDLRGGTDGVRALSLIHI